MDKNSNIYTLLYAAGMVIICAIALAGTVSALNSKIQKNEDLENKFQILKSVNPDLEKNETVIALFDESIVQSAINSKGEVIEIEGEPFSVDLGKEVKKPIEDRILPVFSYTNPETGTKNTILPMRGKGLWDWIGVFVALEPDFATIAGTTFSHKAETPGLGAEITKDWFQDQFKGKTLCDPNDEYHLAVLKGKGNPIEGKLDLVDGITGATMTCIGVQDMFEEGFNSYRTYFSQQTTQTN